MRILLINPPHTAIGSRIPVEHLPPLGLLAIGGPLLDAGHHVELLDAEFGPMSLRNVVNQALALAPDAILIGHSGSTSVHPTVVELTSALRLAMPGVWIVYGGVFPTFHSQEILASEPQIDVIVRGEGEEIVARLIAALENGDDLERIPGIAFRDKKNPESARVFVTPDAAPISNLDSFRIGWELIDHKRYTYWGERRAVVVQFSRGCPHHCNYCGQRIFWARWRHRDPKRFAAELARLHREQGVEVVNFADENPTALREAWKSFLEALISEHVSLTLVGSTRAGDIVRDADILHLYKEAGVARFLLGMESTDDETLQKIRKGSTSATDREAIRLLRQHGILSMVAFVAGFDEETDRDYWRTLRQLISYDPAQIQAVYSTPHRWTPYFQSASQRRVIQTDLRLWDYKHQVLETRGMSPWRIFLWMKFIEAVVQLRPKSLFRVLWNRDPGIHHATRWYYQIGRRVWVYELWNFIFRDRRTRNGPRLSEFFQQLFPSNSSTGKSVAPEWRSPELVKCPSNPVAASRESAADSSSL